MSFIQTALGGFSNLIGGIGNIGAQITGDVTGLIAALNPAFSLAGQFGLLPQLGTGGIDERPVGPPPPTPPPISQPFRPVNTGVVALPGGAHAMATLPTSPLLMATAGQSTLGEVVDIFQGQTAGSTIRPRTTQSTRLPHTAQVADGRGGFATYVKAPKAIFKVTVRQARRCRKR